MKNEKIHIDEENTQIIWGLIAVVAIGTATYMLVNAFMAGSWEIAGSTQLMSLGLFSIGFYSIIRITSPLFHFVLFVEKNVLNIEIWRDAEEPLKTQKIKLDNIKELRIAPHTPRSQNEALFDFSSSYYLLYQTDSAAEYKRLIDLEDASFTLKVKDIGKIIEFLASENPDIQVPKNDAIFTTSTS